MADPVATAGIEEDGGDDVEMEQEGGEDADLVEADGGEEAVDLPDIVDSPRRVAFLDYLRSPMVELTIGPPGQATNLTAHQDLLTKSPYFEQACAAFAGSAARQISLPDEDLDAMGSFLEYLYMGEYFPRRRGEGRDATLESDPSIPVPDHSGEQLLKHARVYNLGEKFLLPALKSLAHAKVHATTSTARGELAYARYIYSTTPADDSTARRPVAAFWATRSHVLRHEAEEEFRAMCLEFPQFGFDVLSQVLDQKERQRGGGGEAAVAIEMGTPASGSGRGKKRQRMSGI